MPGFEIIGKEEKLELNSIFKNGSVLFRHSFDDKESSYKKEFENKFRKKFNSKYSLRNFWYFCIKSSISNFKPQKDDEIITQAFTFVATIESIVDQDKPVICEIDETLNMDPNDLINKISKNKSCDCCAHAWCPS